MDRYRNIRNVIRREYGDNIFKWQNLCKEINLTSKLSELQEWAKFFGVPPQFWNEPRKICALITPRVNDYKEKVVCDNDDEYTMEGEAVDGIPEYLKYTYIDPVNGRRYCYSLFDLYKSIEFKQTRDPYRRFEFSEKVKDDVKARVEFIKKAIEPHGYGESIMEKIRDTVLSVIPQQYTRLKLVDVWGKLHYPKYQIDEFMNAGEDILNGIFISLSNVGLPMLFQEKELFVKTRDNKKKRDILIEILSRLANSDENIFALEHAINESVPMNLDYNMNIDESMDEIQRLPVLQRRLGHKFTRDEIREGRNYELDNISFDFFNSYHLTEPSENLLNHLVPYNEMLEDFHMYSSELSGDELMLIYNRLVPIIERNRNPQELTALNSLFNFLQRIIVETVNLNIPDQQL